jgi:glutathione S-transferase
MKLFHSPASPYVRKVMVLAYETGLIERIDCLRAVVSPIERDLTVAVHNPTGHVPTLLLDDGTALFDSAVICQYLDSLHDGAPLHPAEPLARARELCLQALADGLLNAGVLVRYETVLRPEPLRWQDWIDGQLDKVVSSLAVLERHWLPNLQGPLGMGAIATGCALGWLDFRFPGLPWRGACPGLARWYGEFALRPSMQATWPSPVI